MQLPKLPIDSILPKLRKILSTHPAVVLAAEPGSGKTTIVPLALIHEPWLQGKKIIMLEPRRIAARMAAKRLSELAGDKLGGLVGYRIRFERKISDRTRIEVVTEGVFTRMIQNDPELSTLGLVIFDEFHNRSIASDLALAFCLDSLELRDDLKILIMSATMDTDRVSRLLDGAPIIEGEGRCYPVAVNYLSRPSSDYPVQRMLKAIHRALAEQEGDILAFLPGAGEIRAVQKQLQADVLCLPLYGDLPQNKQDLVFKGSAKRRVILATPIAETSLTIEGVSTVIDSGLMKTPRFSPATGLTTLHTIPISRASADQRAGRAGRLAPGTCYRLWTVGEEHSRADFLPAEIVGADLAPLLLETLSWGVADPAELRWLDPPREGQVEQARALLVQLGAINEKGMLTTTGKKIAALPLHPRLALMLILGREQGHGSLACRLAALLQQRDLLRGGEQQSVDIEDRLEILRLHEQKKTGPVRARGADPALCRRILQEASQYQRLLGIQGSPGNFSESGNLLALAYPDRIAGKKPGSNQHLLASGKGVLLPAGDHLHQAEYLVAANLTGGKKQGRIYLAASLSLTEIIHDHKSLLKKEDRVEWKNNKVETASVLSLGHLELTREPLRNIDPYTVRNCLLEGIQQTGIHCLNRQKKSLELQARMQSAHIQDPDNWPDVSDETLINDLGWLEPWLDGITSLKQLRKIDLYPILLAQLSWPEQQRLETLLPTHLRVPSGSRVKLIYQPGDPPVLAVRLQEMFGATDTPTVFNGQVPVQIHLLSPARRPVQITSDLQGFWQNSYHLVKKDMAGRYPKHYWPDDPLQAAPTTRVKRKKKIRQQ
jgi:ATP-dependent helicase HrpB